MIGSFGDGGLPFLRVSVWALQLTPVLTVCSEFPHCSPVPGSPGARWKGFLPPDTSPEAHWRDVPPEAVPQFILSSRLAPVRGVCWAGAGHLAAVTALYRCAPLAKPLLASAHGGSARKLFVWWIFWVFCFLNCCQLEERLKVGYAILAVKLAVK